MGEVARRNVYVVGAGASTDFGLPVGSDLKAMIAERCNFNLDEFASPRGGSVKLRRAIENLGARGEVSHDALFRAAENLSRAMPAAPSIDNYLHTNASRPEVVAVGKMAIIESIAAAEKSSRLMVDPRNSYNKLDMNLVKDSWLGGLSSLLLSSSDFASFLEGLENITFVTFNYDRCIEQYFSQLARVYFADVRNADIDVMQRLSVIHVYGSLGEFTHSGYQYRGYGIEPNEMDLIDARGKIKVFTEGTFEDDVQGRISEALSECEVLLFLGFGFHPINVRLFPNNRLERLERLIVTSRGFSSDDLRILAERLHDRFGVPPSFEAREAKDVFQVYRLFFQGEF
jgi:hypothetical protein